jgi:hypothetical protein
MKAMQIHPLRIIAIRGRMTIWIPAEVFYTGRRELFNPPALQMY